MYDGFGIALASLIITSIGASVGIVAFYKLYKRTATNGQHTVLQRV